MEKVLSEGARTLLQVTIENEVVEYLENNREQRAEDGERVLLYAMVSSRTGTDNRDSPNPGVATADSSSRRAEV